MTLCCITAVQCQVQLKCRTFLCRPTRHWWRHWWRRCRVFATPPPPQLVCRFLRPSRVTRRADNRWMVVEIRCVCATVWCAGGRASAGVSGLPWWECEGGSAVSPGWGSSGLRGSGVSVAANVWPVWDRDVAVRWVLFADAVGGWDSCWI